MRIAQSKPGEEISRDTMMGNTTPPTLEQGRDADRRAHALGQQDLVVFRSQAAHHDAKDVQKGASEQQPPRPIVAVIVSHDRPHSHYKKDLQRRDPRHGAGRVLTQQLVFVVRLEDADVYRA